MRYNAETNEDGQQWNSSDAFKAICHSILSFSKVQVSNFRMENHKKPNRKTKSIKRLVELARRLGIQGIENGQNVFYVLNKACERVDWTQRRDKRFKEGESKSEDAIERDRSKFQ